MPDFEKSFSDYLDSNDYDRLQGTLLSAIRAAYNAGWIAAGGEEPKSQDEQPTE